MCGCEIAGRVEDITSSSHYRGSEQRKRTN